MSISLQNGFTTLRDVCTEGAGFADVDISRAIDSGFIIGSCILLAYLNPNMQFVLWKDARGIQEGVIMELISTN